ncbi:MAG: ORMDL family, partial [Piptocephalis tieghemiana]
NFNSNWVSQRGAWTVHVLVIIFLKIGLVSIPGVSDAASWTLTLLIYDIATFFMFHWTLGTPFQYEQGDFDSMTLWEQIDQGEQYTDTKKYLTAVPVLLYFLAIHYTAYDLTSFIIVTTCTIINMIGKMPYMHNRRIFGINK